MAADPNAPPFPEAWDNVYPELKKIARARLFAAGSGVGLNTTALVHESYLRLADRVGQLSFASSGHFYAYAAQVMRSVIVDLVREHQAERRGGGAAPVTLDTAVAQAVSANGAGSDEALQVDQALTAL
ncbi:MAG: RNA polymerase subunit sigma, partial [Burkholderiales bacterium PBB5]